MINSFKKKNNLASMTKNSVEEAIRFSFASHVLKCQFLQLKIMQMIFIT